MDQRPDERPARAFVARQPIFNDKLGVHAYELLFRSSPVNRYGCENHSRASSTVIASGALLMDLGSLSSGKRLFVNVTREVLLGGHIRLLPAESTVVELLEGIEPAPEILAVCRELRREGYRLALDDFVYDDGLMPLVELADYVKIDFLATSPPERERIARRLGGGPVRLVAEKIETHEALREGRDLGYALFQGFFFSRPVVLSTREVPGYKLNVLAVLNEVHRHDLDYDGLERVIKQDMALCYKLLRYVNAAHHGLRHRIESIRRALILLGQEEVRKWASLVALTMIGGDRPQELIRLALTRAKFCESLAPAVGLDARSEDLFLTGLFSVIDTALGRPMSELLAPLPIHDEIKCALLGEPNLLRSAYDLALAYEQGEWRCLDSLAGRTGEAAIARLYIDALDWGSTCLAIGTAS